MPSKLFEHCPNCDTPNPAGNEMHPLYTCFNCGYEFKRRTIRDVIWEAYHATSEWIYKKYQPTLNDLEPLLRHAYEAGLKDGAEDKFDKDYEQLCKESL